jgi:hypothetical protein
MDRLSDFYILRITARRSGAFDPAVQMPPLNAHFEWLPIVPMIVYGTISPHSKNKIYIFPAVPFVQHRIALKQPNVEKQQIGQDSFRYKYL